MPRPRGLLRYQRLSQAWSKRRPAQRSRCHRRPCCLLPARSPRRRRSRRRRASQWPASPLQPPWPGTRHCAVESSVCPPRSATHVRPLLCKGSRLRAALGQAPPLQHRGQSSARSVGRSAVLSTALKEKLGLLDGQVGPLCENPAAALQAVRHPLLPAWGVITHPYIALAAMSAPSDNGAESRGYVVLQHPSGAQVLFGGFARGLQAHGSCAPCRVVPGRRRRRCRRRPCRRRLPDRSVPRHLRLTWASAPALWRADLPRGHRTHLPKGERAAVAAPSCCLRRPVTWEVTVPAPPAPHLPCAGCRGGGGPHPARVPCHSGAGAGCGAGAQAAGAGEVRCRRGL